MNKSISPDALMRQIIDGTAPVVVDVRSAAEFADGHIPGAMHMPFWQVGRQREKLAAMREAPIVLYCGHGPRAYIAGEALTRYGFSDVKYLAGHMKKWKAMKLPLEGK